MLFWEAREWLRQAAARCNGIWKDVVRLEVSGTTIAVAVAVDVDGMIDEKGRRKRVASTV